MENIIELPPILPLEYDGKPVLNTKQLSNIFSCRARNITVNFQNHFSEFQIGEDYYFLEGNDAMNFKANLRFTKNADYITSNSISSNCPPFHLYANHFYLWTESGVFKHSRILNTYKAAQMYAALAIKYFHPVTQNGGAFNVPAQKSLTQQQIKPSKLKISNDTEIEKLVKLIKAAGIFEPRKCVYILEMENGIIKIGISQNFQQRARQIINSSGLNVKNWCHTGFIENAREIEKNCLEHFDFCQIDGEFFNTDFDSAVLKLSKHAEIIDFMNII